MTKLLMCAPHNAVSEATSPGISTHAAMATSDASRQWDRLVEILSCAGDVQIERLEPHPGMPDLVFTANAALLSGRLAVLSSFRHPERRREQRFYRTSLARQGFATTSLESTYFEGAGDALFDRRRPYLYLGYGWRSERVAAALISETLAVRTLPLLLVDERFFHLNTCFCPLGSGHLMLFMDAFSAPTQKMLRRTIEAEYLLELSLEDALSFACNAVEIDSTLVLHAASVRLRERLAGIGYRVFATDLSEFHKAGGSAKCLTLRLEDGPARAEAVA